jgi:hypothetical protein
MNEVRIKAVKLRKQGFSYNEITAKIGVPKSTLSGWLKGIQLSQAAQSRLNSRVSAGVKNGLVKRNKLQTKKAQERAAVTTKEYSGQVGVLSTREIMLVGAALYWGEGYKKKVFRDGKERTAHEIRFVNADPKMIQIFLRFLSEVLNIPTEQVHLAMRLYNHINEEVARKYWMNITGLDATYFKQTTWLVSGASKRVRPRDSLPYGTLQVAVYRTENFYQIIGLIEGLKNNS